MITALRAPLLARPQRVHLAHESRKTFGPRSPTLVRSQPSSKGTPGETGSPGATSDDEDTVGLSLKPYKEGSRLVSDNWEGDTYRGSNFNILTLILGLIFFVPVIGLAVAYFSYGSLWGTVSYFSY